MFLLMGELRFTEQSRVNLVREFQDSYRVPKYRVPKPIEPQLENRGSK